MSSGQPASLGSRKRPFIPMAPRSLKSKSELYNPHPKVATSQPSSGDTADGPPPQKKFKSNIAPKGSKLAAGYVDRAKERTREQDGTKSGEDKQKRLEALEEMLKLEQIDQAVFQSLRDEIGIGGDLESTHLVKGLDFKLLERARRGEDVTATTTTVEEMEEIPPEDIEAELEKELEKEAALPAESGKNRSTSKVTDEEHSSSTAPVTSLTRDELLKRLKENRKNPILANPNDVSIQPGIEPQQSSLDHSRFRKLESASKPNKRKFTEMINGRRREVLVITDKEGKTKRKTRWLDPEPDPSAAATQSSMVAWGSDLPAEVLAQQKAAAAKAAQQAEEEDGDDDIFGGVQDYNPLAEIESEEEKEDDHQTATTNIDDDDAPAKPAVDSVRAAPLKSTARQRNYFGTNAPADEPESSATKDVAHDPAILAALKRAAQLRREEEEEEENPSTRGNADAEAETGGKPLISHEDESRNRALLKKLQQQSQQDDLDVDMGFGGDTKYDDEEEEGEDGGRRRKLSEWNGVDGYGDDDDDGGAEVGKKDGGQKRKRGSGKKRKGDKNSVADVLSVLEKRKTN